MRERWKVEERGEKREEMHKVTYRIEKRKVKGKRKKMTGRLRNREERKT